MTIDVNCFATLARYAPPGGIAPLEPGMTVALLISRLGIPPGQVKVVFVNGLHAALEDPLTKGDRVGIFPAVAGG